MPYLPAAVGSILTQSYADFDFLIVDDGSTDGSLDYLRSLSDARIRLSAQKNAGLGTTLNRMLALCETKYFARMDSDDIANRRRLELQMNYLTAHPDVVMVGTQFDFLVGHKRLRMGAAPLDHASIERRLLEGKSGVCHPTIIFQTEAARSFGGYRIGGAGEDIDFCLRMIDCGRAANLQDVVYSYRIHESSIGMTRRADLHLGYSYAIECASCRRQGQPEPSFQGFKADWSKRSQGKRLLEKLDDIAEIHYRRGLIAARSGQFLAGPLHLFLATLLRPRSAINRFGTLLRRSKRESLV
jgi:glycosyltransferase involved in cell wall biosynthesis